MKNLRQNKIALHLLKEKIKNSELRLPQNHLEGIEKVGTGNTLNGRHIHVAQQLVPRHKAVKWMTLNQCNGRPIDVKMDLPAVRDKEIVVPIGMQVSNYSIWDKLVYLMNSSKNITLNLQFIVAEKSCNMRGESL